MTKSALQIARAAYQPKLPKALKGAVKVVEGEATQSVADQEEIKKLFPNTYGMPLLKFVEGERICSGKCRCHPFGWTGSGRTQCDFRSVRRYQKDESSQQTVRIYLGSWRFGRP